jgi:hypothetical protein
MSSLHQELVNFAQFLEAILLCGFYTGLISVPFILIGYESVTKRRI